MTSDVVICFPLFWEYQLQKIPNPSIPIKDQDSAHTIPSPLLNNSRIHISDYCLISGQIASHLFSLLVLLQDTINVSRGDGKDSNPKGINRLSREFQYLPIPHFPSNLPVVTDLLMNETISDLALAKVCISYSLLHCALH